MFTVEFTIRSLTEIDPGISEAQVERLEIKAEIDQA